MPSAITHLYPADEAGQPAVDAQDYRRLLHDLIDFGVDLARAVHQKGTAQAGAVDLGLVATFEHAARGVRRAVALAHSRAEPAPAPAGTGRQRAAARRRLIREVDDVIQRITGSAEAEELEDEFDSRPAAETIADICRDLGVAVRGLGVPPQSGNPPGKGRAPRDIEALCARAARPRAASGSSDAGADSSSLPLDAGADLLQFTPPDRGP